MPQRYSGYLFILLAAWCWGLLGILSKFLLSGGMHPLEAAFWRSAFGALLFIAHSLFFGSLKIQKRADVGAFLFFGAFSVALFFTSYQYSVQHAGAAVASVLLYTAPAWVAVFSRLFFKEWISPLKVMAIAISLAGAACVSFSDAGASGGVSLAGIAFGLLAGLCYSSHYVFSTIYLERYSAITIYGFGMAVGSLLLLPFVPFSDKTPFDWLVAFSLGFITCYVAYQAYCAGLRRLSPVRTAVLATFEPISAVIMAWVVWDERLSFPGWLGAGLILVAVLLIVMERKTDGVEKSAREASR